jgi:hypothetical protein
VKHYLKFHFFGIMRNLILLIYIFSTLASCDRLDGLDEGDRNTYTWKGQLVKDCDGQAAQNVSLTLESSYVGFPDGDMETIGEITTDENGNFAITYKKIRKVADGVSLSMPNTQYTNRLLLNAPVDKNVNRDKAIDDCYTVYIDIQNGSNQVKLKRLVFLIKPS